MVATVPDFPSIGAIATWLSQYNDTFYTSRRFAAFVWAAYESYGSSWSAVERFATNRTVFDRYVGEMRAILTPCILNMVTQASVLRHGMPAHVADFLCCNDTVALWAMINGS